MSFPDEFRSVLAAHMAFFKDPTEETVGAALAASAAWGLELRCRAAAHLQEWPVRRVRPRRGVDLNAVAVWRHGQLQAASRPRPVWP